MSKQYYQQRYRDIWADYIIRENRHLKTWQFVVCKFQTLTILVCVDLFERNIPKKLAEK